MIRKRENALITNIQHFCLQDGPGIRTTVFLKGCSLHCPWCSNPENIKNYAETYYEDDMKGIYGKYWSCEEIEREIIKDIYYYECEGGVTWSGGEPLLQFLELQPVLKRIKERNIHQAVETALFVPKECLEIALKYINLFIVDVKILNKEQCKMVLGGNVDSYLDNIQNLFYHEKKVIFRIPMIENYTTDTRNIKYILEFLREYKPYKVELLEGHNLAEKKYQSLGKEMVNFAETPKDVMLNLKNNIEKLEIECDIVGLV